MKKRKMRIILLCHLNKNRKLINNELESFGKLLEENWFKGTKKAMRMQVMNIGITWWTIQKNMLTTKRWILNDILLQIRIRWTNTLVIEFKNLKNSNMTSIIQQLFLMNF